MTSHSAPPDPAEPTTVEPPPDRPPLEIVEGGTHWVLEAYNRGRRDATTYSIHDRQMEALRAGKRQMDEQGHPCLLRWDSDNSVGTLYWNPNFEHLLVQQGQLTDQWVVVPEAGSIPFYTTDRQELAARYGRAVQRTYNFKHLHLYTPSGVENRTIDHRFLRHDIDASGVVFDRDQISDKQGADPLTTSEDDSEEEITGPTTPASALAAAMPDLSDVEVLLNEGPLHRYRAGWTDGGDAAIIALDPDRCDQQAAVDAFIETVERWSTLAENDHVVSVYDDGIGPSPWIVYDAGAAALPEKIDELDLRTRLRFADEIAGVYETALLYDVPRRGAVPSNVLLDRSRGQWRASLADWGLSRSVMSALNQSSVDPYTAPEQLSGSRTDWTPIYRLGALTYYLATRRPPFSAADDLKQQIKRGSPKPPSSVADVPDGLDEVVRRAMATDVADRFNRIEGFRDALSTVIDP
jgi:hypothetical protein